MSEKVSEWIISCPRLTSREEIAEKVVQLEADNAALKKRVVELDSWGEELEQENQRLPGIKIADGTVWLVFPGAIISIDAIAAGRGPIVQKNLRAWRDKILEGGDDGQQEMVT